MPKKSKKRTKKGSSRSPRRCTTGAKNVLKIAIISSIAIDLGFYSTIFTTLGEKVLAQIYLLDPSKTQEMLDNTDLFFATAALVSVIASGYLANKLGRYFTFLLSLLISGVSYVLYFRNNLTLLLIARLLSGVVIGLGASTSQMLVKELFPRKFTFFGGALLYFMAALSSFTFFAVRLLLGEKFLLNNWRFVVIAPAPFCVLRFLIFAVLKLETPEYFMANKRRPFAKTLSIKVLDYIYKDGKAADKAWKKFEKLHDLEAETNISTSTLCNTAWKKQFTAALVVNIGQQFSGISFMDYFSAKYYQGSESRYARLYCLVSSGLTLVCLVVVLNFGERIGRKNLLKFGALIQGVCLGGIVALEHFGLDKYVVVVVVLYSCFAAIGLKATTFIYTFDILPAIGAGICLGFQWGFSALLGKFIPAIIIE